MDLETIIGIMAKSYHFRLTVIEPPFSCLADFDFGLRRVLEPHFDFETFGKDIYRRLPSGVLVLTTDEFNCSYALVRPGGQTPVYLLGPVIRTRITEDIIKQILRQYGTSQMEQFMGIYQELRIAYDTCGLDFIRNLLAEFLPHVEFVTKTIPDFLPMGILRTYGSAAQEEELEYLKQQDQLRQGLLLMDAIAAGDSGQAMISLGHLEGYTPSQIFPESHLNMKNQAAEINSICKYIICATHKVHPQYVLQVYKTYALQLRAADTPQAISQLTRQMVLSYCNCIRGNTLNAYSSLVRQVIEHIHLNVRSPLSLHALSADFHVNASYLSNLFRKETGLTLTEYINRYRVERSLPLLQFTQMSLAQVSESVGFLDENYYARIFKRIMGMPPKAFRKDSQI